MKNLLFPIFLLPGIAAFPQKVIDVGKQDVRVTSSMFYVAGGRPVSIAKYVKVVSGTPYFSDNWMYGRVELADGHLYDSVKLKLDLADNSVLFLAPDSTEMIATASIKDVTLIDASTGKEYFFIFSSFIKATGNVETGWYQVLGTGKATICKLVEKRIEEMKPYGSATFEENIATVNRYFVFINSVLSAIKKFKDLPDILSDKKVDLKKYISNKKLTGKTDEDYADLVMYYNGLVTK